MGAWEEYERLKKERLAKTTANNENTENTTSGGAWATYEQMKREYGLYHEVNDEFIDTFITDATNFINSTQRDYDTVGWSNASTVYDTRNSIYKDIYSRFRAINMWINKNKNNLDPETYDSFKSSLNEFDKGLTSADNVFKSAKDFYAQFDTEDAYNAWQAAEDEKQAILNSDDFGEYSQKGANVYNPDIKNVHKESDKIGNVVTFSRKYCTELAFGEVNGGGGYEYGLKAIYNLMEEDEVNVYNYYLAKYGKDKAGEYLASLEDTLRKRQAGNMVQMSDDTAAELLFSLGAGLEQFKTGVLNLDNLIMGTELDDIPVSAETYAYQEMSSNNDGIWKVANDLANTTGNMLPSILLSAVVPVGGAAVGAVSMGASAAGNAYAEMRNLGYTANQARAYAGMVGVSEAALQYALGGISKLGGKAVNKVAGDLVAKYGTKFTTAIAGIDNAVARIAVKYGGQMALKMGSEAFEESLQSVLEPMFKSIVTGENLDIDWEEVAYSGLLGALSAGFLEGGTTLAGTIYNDVATTKYGQSLIDNNSVPELQSLANDMMGVSKETDMLSAKVNTKQTAHNVGELSLSLGKSVEVQNLTAITNALVEKGLSQKEAQKVAEKLLGSEKLSKKQMSNEAIKAVAEELVNNPNSAINERNSRLRDARLGVKNPTVEIAKKVSEDGKTTRVSTGEAITIDKSNPIAKTNNGKVYFNTNKGVVESSDIKYASKDEGLIYESFVDLNPAFANALIKNYDGKTPVQSYIKGMREGVVVYGKHHFQGIGKDISNATYFAELSETDQAFALKLGRNLAEYEAKVQGAPLRQAIRDAAKKAEAEGKNTASTKPKEVTFRYEEKLKKAMAEKKVKLNPSQKRIVNLVNHLSKALGMNVVIYDATMVENEELRKSNGGYVAETNTLYLDLQNATTDRKTIAYTLSHELVHWLKAKSATDFNNFAKFLMEQYTAHGVDTEKLLRNKMVQYKTKDADYAFEEMIAEACETLLLDSNAVPKLMELRKADLNLFEKIMLHIHELINKIRAEYKKYSPTSDEAKALLGMTDVLDQIYAKFEEAMVGAAKVAEAESIVGVSMAFTANDAMSGTDVTDITHKPTMKLQEKTEYDAAPKEMISLTKSGSNRKPMDIKINGKKFKGSASVRELRNARFEENGFDSKVVTKVNNFLDKMRDYLVGAREKYVYVGLKDIYNAKIIISPTTGNIVLSGLVNNGDYEINFDFTKTCKKKIALQEVIEQLAREKGAKNEDGTQTEINLSEENIRHINEILAANGIETACLCCFVESKRYAVQSHFQEKVCDVWNRLVDEVNSEDGITKEAPYFNFADQNVNDSKIPDGEYDRLYSDLERWRGYKFEDDGEGEGAVERKMKAFLINTPNARKKLRLADFVTESGRTNLHKLYPDIESLAKAKIGTALPKAIEAFAPYNGEIELLEVSDPEGIEKYVMKIAGARSQSFSDFLMSHVYDVLQKTASLMARKLTAHTYTKEISRARLFGMTGEKTNMSVLHEIDPNVDSWNAGLHEDGTYFVSDYEAFKNGKCGQIQAIPDTESIALQNTDGYSRDCGRIGVGFSYTHMLKMHNDPDIRQVIGYHSSSLPLVLKPLTNLDKATDYTPVQNTLKFKGFRKPNFDIPDGIPSYATPPQDVEPRFKVTKKGTQSTQRESKYAKSDATFDIKGTYAELCETMDSTKAAKETLRQLLQFASDNGLALETSKYKSGRADFDLYVDTEQTQNPYLSADHYIEYCISNGLIPMFYEFALNDNYYKDIYDFNPFDRLSYNPETGLHEDSADRKAYAPQSPVTMVNEDGSMAFPDDFWELVDKYMKDYNYQREDFAKKFPKIMKEVRAIKDAEGKPMVSTWGNIIKEVGSESIPEATEQYTDVENTTRIKKQLKNTSNNTYENIGKELMYYEEGDLAPDLTLVETINERTGNKEVTIKHHGQKPKGYVPKKIAYCYKLFEQHPDGSLHALFAGAKNGVPIGEWRYAQGFPRTDEGVKGMNLRERYGWHLSAGLPSAPHLMSSKYFERGYPSKGAYGHPKGSKRVWVRMAYDASMDFNAIADSTGKQNDIYGLIPFGGYYAFKENNQSEWVISSAVKIDKILTEEERQQILKEAGYDEYEAWRLKYQPTPEEKAARELANKERAKAKARAKKLGIESELSESTKAMRENIKSRIIDNPELKGLKRQIKEIVGESGTNYGMGVYLDSTLLSDLTENERVNMVKEYVKELGGSVFTAYDNNHNAVGVHIVESNRRFKNKTGRRVPVYEHMLGYLKDEIKQEAIVLVDELITTSAYGWSEPANYPHGWLDNNGANDWESWTTYLQDKENTVWEATLKIANSENGEKILYEIYPIKMVEQSGKPNTSTTDNNIAQKKPIVKGNLENTSKTSETDGLKSQLKDTSKYAPTFYSHMGKVIDGIKMDKIGSASLIPFLKGKGVKHDEIKWSGIEAFLEGKKSVTKAELQEFLAGSQLQIEEEMSGKDINLRYDGSNRAYNLYDSNGNVVDTFTYNAFMDGYIAESDEEFYSNEYELRDALREEYGASAPRWAEYKLDGGTNYRELVFKAPIIYSNFAMRNHWGIDAESILAHARIQDMVTADGKKMLFIEELQSDWHNEGAKEGYQDEKEAAKITDLQNKADEAFFKLEDYSTEVTGSAGEWETIVKTEKGAKLLSEYREAQAKYDEAMNHVVKLVPDAPFKDTYHEYVLKRLLRMAAEEGYDSIGWTPAIIQDERWSDNQYHEEGKGKSGFLKGYTVEYDQDIPKFLSKYGKKWGATVGHTTVNDTQVWSMDITEPMEQSVLYEGQMKFQKKAVSNRTILANALETTIDTSTQEGQNELKKLKEYQKVISDLEKEEAHLAEVKKQIHDISFTKGSDRSKLTALNEDKIKTQNRIHTYDSQLVKLEAMKPIQDVLEREKELVRQKTEKEAKEYFDAYREQITQVHKEDIGKERERSREALERVRRARERDEVAHRWEIAEMREAMAKLRKEMATAIGEERKKKVEAIDKLRAKMREALAKQKAEMQNSQKEAVANVRETRDKQEAKKKLYKLVLETIDWIEHPKKTDVKCPDILKAPFHTLLKSINFDSERALNGGSLTKNDLRIDSAMNSLANTLEKLRESQAAEEGDANGFLDLPGDFVRVLRNMADAITDRMNAIGSLNYVVNGGLNSNDIKVLTKLISQLTRSIKMMNTLYANLRFANAQMLGVDSIGFLDSMGEAEKINSVKDFVIWDNALPYYAFKKFGEAGESIFEELMDAQDKMAYNAKKILDFKEKTWTDKEAKEWGSDTHTIYLPSGGTVNLTTANAMGIYCLSRRDNGHGLNHLVGGGIRVVGLTKGATKAKDSRATLTFMDVEEIIDSLTPRQKQVAEAIQEFMSTVGSAWGNEISMKRFLTNDFTERVYYPIESDNENLNTELPEASQGDLYRLLNISATKALTEGANNRVIIRDIFDVFTNHMSDMARLNAYGMALLDYMKWLNYREKTVNDDGQIHTRGVRQSMNNTYGDKAMKYVLNLIKDINGRHTDNGDNPFLMKMIRLGKTAAVGANLRVAFLQFTSYPRAAMVLSKKSLILGLTKLPKIRMAEKYCGIALWKSFGFYDTNIARSIEDQIKGTTNIPQKIIELSMTMPGLADAITWGLLWNACEYEVAKTTQNKVGSEEFYQEVGKKLREVVYATQVVDSVLTRSQIMRSKSGLTQMTTAYMSEPTLSANILMDAGFQFEKEKRESGSAKVAWKATRKIIFKATAMYCNMALLSALFESLADAWRDDDDDKFAEKFLEAFKENSISNLNPANKLPIFSDIAEGITSLFGIGYFDSGNMAFDWLEQIKDAVNVWTEVLGEELYDENTSKTVYNAIYKTAKVLSSVTGVSVSGAMREVVAVWNNIAGAYDSTLKIRLYESTNEELGNELYEAILEGDERQSNSLREQFEDEDAINSALRTALRNNDSRIKEAAQADVNGNVDEYDRIVSEILAEGYFSENNIKGAIKAEINKLLPDEDDESNPKKKSIYDAKHYYLAVMDGNSTLASKIKEDIVDTAMENGDSRDDAEDSFESSFRKYCKDEYKNGTLSRSKAMELVIKHGGYDSNKAYWELKEWDYYIANGTDEGYSKYTEFYEAVRTGKNIKAIIKEYTDHGVETKTLASQITSYYKPLYKAMTNSERASIKGYLLNAYALLGYNRAEKSKDIDNWLKD